MQLINETIEQYCKEFTSPLDEVRTANELFTTTFHAHAQMHSGYVQGKVLEMFSYMLRPSRVLEIGTFTGFSALSLVKGMVPNGILHTIELREEDAETAKQYFKDAKEPRIVQHVGNALDIIPTLNEAWDLIFIDADKVGYIDYYELTLPNVKTGGIILADNVLFHGEVFQTPLKGKNAIAIDRFNRYIREDNRVEQVMLSIRDGLMVIRKL